MPERLEIKAKLIGGSADRHVVDAQSAGQTLYGIGRSLTLITHYAVESKIRRRTPYSENANIYFHAVKPGSIEYFFSIEVITHLAALFGPVATGVSANLLTNFIGSIWRNTTGRLSASVDDRIQFYIREHSGDFQALSDAVEPSLRQAHNIIGRDASQIVVSSGDNAIFNFNSTTKNYLNSNLTDDEFRWLDISISAINGNQKTGRAFLIDENRSVPFSCDNDINDNAIVEIAESAYQYLIGNIHPISVRYRATRSQDQTIKKIRIYDAEPIK